MGAKTKWTAGGRGRAGALLVLLSGSVAGCERSAGPPAVARPARLVAQPLEEEELVGLSGAAVDPAGRVWVASERQQALARLEGPAPWRVVERVRLEGIPAGQDVEAVAIHPDGRFVLGVESTEEGRETEPLFLAARMGDRLVVQERVDLPYGPWELRSQRNNGIEGLCAAGDLLVAALERVVVHDGHRRGPLGIYDLATRRWTALWLALTSEKGKVSGLECRIAKDIIELWVIERTFGVAHLARYSLPVAVEAGTVLRAQRVLDIYDHEGPQPAPNYEAIVRLDGAALLVSDNHYGQVTGPTMVLRVDAADF